jgi:DNA polymerase III subunit delta
VSPAATRQSGPAEAQVYLIRGDDPSLVAQQARRVIDDLVGSRTSALAVEEHGNSGEDLDVRAVVDACRTPPLLEDRRIVVVRDAGRLSASDATSLVAVMGDLPQSIILVLVAGGGTLPTAVSRAAAASGVVMDTSVGSGRDRSRWLADRLRDAPVRFDAAARGRLDEHLGEDLGRLAGLIESVVAAYGERASVSVAELEPFLGTAGAIPPWELTDAIDGGSIPDALRALGRMLGAGNRHPTEVLGVLHRHYATMLRVDGAALDDPDAAAAALGIRPFVAKKAIGQSRRLGSRRIAEAIGLLAGADLDVKGRTALSPELVLEILVARLSRQVRARAAAR